MAAITVRNLDPRTIERLKAKAREHGRSLEAEVRRLLDDAVRGPTWLGDAHNLVEALDLDAIARGIRPARSGPRPPRAPVRDWGAGRSLADDVIEARERP